MSRPNPITMIVNGPPDPALVVVYDRAHADGPAVVGGKGYNLGRLARYGFHVPPPCWRQMPTAPISLLPPRRAIALTALADATAADAPATVAHPGRARGDPGGAAPSRGGWRGSPGIWRTAASDRPLAVRSSATAEDGAGRVVRRHPRACSASLDRVRWPPCAGQLRPLWTPRALAYRRRFGIADEDVACAVAFCAMIGRPNASRLCRRVAAGVAFSGGSAHRPPRPSRHQRGAGWAMSW